MIQNAWKKVPVAAVPEKKRIPNIMFRRKEEQWRRFLKQHIHLDAGVYNILPRHEAIRTFVEDGLEPYIQEKGYIWIKDTHGITQCILQMMFEMWQGHTIDIPNFQKKYSIEHYERFIMLLGADEWDTFWQSWSCMEDFSDAGYAYRLRFLLQNFVWNNIDLENSAVTEEVKKELAEVEATQEMFRRGGADISKGKDDPYLQDMQQAMMRDKHNY